MNTTPTNYAVVVFHKDKNVAPISFPFVKSVYYIHRRVLQLGYDYHYMNVYHRKTRQYLRRQYCNEWIVDKPAF